MSDTGERVPSLPVTAAIKVKGLSKSYGSNRAVDGIDLAVDSGEVVAVLGPNGAGKTTTVEILEGFRNGDDGEVEVLGMDPATSGRAIRDRIGIVLQESGIEEELTVAEAVDQVALRARVTGFLHERLFEEGKDVEVGELLFRLERAQYEAEVARLEAAVERAEAELELALIEQRRQEELVQREAVARARLDEAVAEVGITRGTLRVEQAALRQAELNLSYTEITAPIAGRIGRSTYSVGDFVGPESGTAIMPV